MEEQVSDYLLEDFKNLMERSRTHVDAAKAAGNAERLKGAKALHKEAKKACKEIEPLVQRQTALYGINFVHAVKNHGEIAQHIDALHNKAYAFDEAGDSSDEDSDDGAEDDAELIASYEELVTLTRQAVLSIAPILKRMILEAPAPQAPISTPPTTPLPVASPAPTTILPRVSSLDAHSLAPDSPHLSAASFGRNTSAQFDTQSQRSSADALVMGIRSGPDEGVYGPAHTSRSQYPPSRSTSQHSAVSSSLRSIPEPAPRSVPEPAPPIPETNPWIVGQAPPTSHAIGLHEPSGDDSDAADIERRPRAAPRASRGDSPTLPPKKKLPKIPSVPHLATMASNATHPPTGSSPPSSTAPSAYMRSGYHTPHQPNRNTLLCFPPTPSQGRQLPVSAYQVSVDQTADSMPSKRGARQQQNAGQDWPPAHYPPTQPPPAEKRQQATNGVRPHSAASSEVSVDTFLENVTAGPPQSLAPDTVSPVAESPSTGFVSRTSSYTSRAGHEKAAPSPATTGTTLQPHLEQPGLEVVVSDPGMIPVHAQPATKEATPAYVPRVRPAVCNIGPGSSFYLLKGFCEGAKEVQRGGAGVKRVKKMAYSNSAPYIAKCTHCFFELSWDAVMNDLKNDPSHNFQYEQLWFRLRFLSKSHMPAKHIDDQLYSCLFCVQEGHTLEESDATVFFTRAQLFAHLLRHPRPLPSVPGLTVIEGPQRPAEFMNDYDVHFTAPPIKSPLEGIRRELQLLPTGTTTTMFRSPRRPHDGAAALQFPAGARIVGIEFPAKYDGEWAVGWYDNMRGTFLMDYVRLDPPPREEMRTQGTSTRQAIARWKWATNNTYKNAEWLRMDKGETISNIVYSHPSHWCWAGTNSRGKWGYFPQSHLDPNSIKESTPNSDTASISSSGRTASISVAATSSNNNSGGGFRFKKWTAKTTNTKRPNSDGSLSTVSSH